VVSILLYRKRKKDALQLIKNLANKKDPASIKLRQDALKRIGHAKRELKQIRKRVAVDNASNNVTYMQSLDNNSRIEDQYIGHIRHNSQYAKDGTNLRATMRKIHDKTDYKWGRKQFGEQGKYYSDMSRYAKHKNKFYIETTHPTQVDDVGRRVPRTIYGTLPPKGSDKKAWIDKMVADQLELSKENNRQLTPAMVQDIRGILTKLTK
jgi:hypothetical protein